MPLVCALIVSGCRNQSQELPHYYSDPGADTTIIHLEGLPGMMVNDSTQQSGPTTREPWIAFLIDDFGPYGTAKLAPEFFSLPFPVTASVIPGNPKSQFIAHIAEQAGAEVFIHLPMEPEVHQSMQERDMVYADADSATLAFILKRAAADIPNAVGLNNHMGSKATTVEPLMGWLAQELAGRGLVFVDSRTGFASRAYPMMMKHRVPTIWRDVFLDNDRDTVAIARQLKRLVNVADKRGWALGLGHAYPQTLAVLKRQAPELVARGIRVVAVSQLIKAVWAQRELAAATDGTSLSTH